jgi:hypothetical protein
MVLFVPVTDGVFSRRAGLRRKVHRRHHYRCQEANPVRTTWMALAFLGIFAQVVVESPCDAIARLADAISSGQLLSQA